ncbi:MAG: hypothetical protein GX456_17785 [Verrucomicrobia bacterium]|nr:hypothetical protein [Verrucomicrobiota bacterium]
MNAEKQYCDISQEAQSQSEHALSAALAGFLAIGIGFSAVSAASAQDASAALRLVHSARPLVIAHRGYCEFAPENTLPSFDLAIRAGADLVELDYHHSKEGQPIVIHDGTLDRTTDATNRIGRVKIAVGTLTVDELKKFDAGAWFDSKYAGTRLPLLSEALEFIQGRGGVTLIERKGGDPATLVALLREHDWVNRVVVQSFDWRYLREFNKLEPQQILGALGPPSRIANGSEPKRPKPLDETWLDLLAETGAKIVVWSREVSRESVAEAHRRGLKVWVYTIDEPALAEAMLDMGVDGIITNNTSLIWRVLALRCSKTRGAISVKPEAQSHAKEQI